MGRSLLLVLLFIPFILNSNPVLPDIQIFDTILTDSPTERPTIDNPKESFSTFKISLDQFEGEISLVGYWNITLGFSAALTYSPDYKYIINNIDDFYQSLILEQERSLRLNLLTTNGLSFKLFSPDDITQTEFSLLYESTGFLKKFYLTNHPEPYNVSAYRTMKNSRSEDITTGIYWGNNIYRGHADIHFNASKPVTERFMADKKLSEGSLLPGDFKRATYFYLPDTYVLSDVEVLVSTDQGIDFSNSTNSNIGGYFTPLVYGKDYSILHENGYITFYNDYSDKTIIINYSATTENGIYKTGNPEAGKKGILNQTDCNIVNTPEYFTNLNGENYLILYMRNVYSPFEEKNSYKIAAKNTYVHDLAITCIQNESSILSGYNYSYDILTGCVRITAGTEKSSLKTIYPFYDYNPEIYLSNQPKLETSKIAINYKASIEQNKLILQHKPLAGTILVYLNGVLTDKVSVNPQTGELLLSDKISTSDTIEVLYMTDDADNFFLNFSQRNLFRLNKYLMIQDAYLFKMPVQLWDTSYIDAPRQSEFLYTTGIEFNGSSLLKSKKADFRASLEGTLTVYIPDLRNMTLIEDFEKNISGITLSLDYRNYYPANIPTSHFATLAGFNHGDIKYRDMYKTDSTSGSLRSIFESGLAQAEEYTNNGYIGPYSSSDGFSTGWSRKTNSQSLILDVKLDPNEAISVILPLSPNEIDLSQYKAITALIEAVEADGNLTVYIDSGKHGEIYQNNINLISETVDEGISYYLDSHGINLIKGRGDKIATSNDFDNNGIITEEDFSQITKWEISDKEYLELSPTQKGVFTFEPKIMPKYTNANGLRITVANHNLTTVNGKILINQLRLLDTGWEYDKSKKSVAEEIFPAEDPVLNDAVFSQKNAKRDSEFHFTRSSERTMRVRLNSEDSTFTVSKYFSGGLRGDTFRNLGFHLYKTNDAILDGELIITDTDGYETSLPIYFNELSSKTWHELIFNVPSHITNDIMIRSIAVHFSKISTTTIFLDEFYFENINAIPGGSIQASLTYSNPEYKIEHNNFTIFASPFLSLQSTFSGAGFSVTSLIPLNANRFGQRFRSGFTLAGIELTADEYITFDFLESGIQSSSEKLFLKILRTQTKTVPLYFLTLYEYQGIYNKTGYTYTKRNTNSIGFVNSFLQMYNTFNSSSYNTDRSRSDSKASFSLKTNNMPIRIDTQISLRSLSGLYDETATFSLENIAYSFKDEIPRFISHSSDYSSAEKILVESSILSFAKSAIEYSSDISLRRFLSRNDITTVKQSILSQLLFHIPDTETMILKTGLSRTIATNITDDTISNWIDFFSLKNRVLFNNYSIFLLPLYPEKRFKEQADLSDMIFAETSFSHFTKDKFFIPSLIKTSLTGNYFNRSVFSMEYLFTFSLSGSHNVENSMFPIQSSLILSTDITFKELYINSKGEANFNILIKSGKNLSSQTDIIYAIFSDGNNKTLAHKIDFKEQLLMTFYKTNDITKNSYGPEFALAISYSAYIYQVTGILIEVVQKPATILLSPEFGYRFNDTITVGTEVNLSYSLQYGSTKLNYTHNFTAEILITGKLSF